MVRFIALACALLVGCSGSEDPSPSSTPPTDEACAAGSMTREDGSCQPAGVPPEACAPGFDPVDGGCRPALPAAPCAPGQLALPGETTCRAVAPCAEGQWGSIAVESDTEHVDAAYTGGASDGSAERPWTTIQSAVMNAAPGAIVAIAEGTYPETVDLIGKAVRLWGRCPELVTITGQPGYDAIVVRGVAHGSEIHDVGIRGSPRGITISGSLDVLVSRVWVHDTLEDAGILVIDQLGETRVVVRDSLIEATAEAGFGLSGGTVTLEASVIRGAKANSAGDFGRGIAMGDSQFTSARSTLEVHGTIIETSGEAGISVATSDLTISGSVVRNNGGRGITIEPAGGVLTLSSSFIEHNVQLGIMVLGSQATIDTTVVRDNQPDSGGLGGRGMNVEPDGSIRSNVQLGWSLFEANRDIGVHVSGSDATLEGVFVRDTYPKSTATDGRGINMEADILSGERANVTIRASRVLRSHAIGVIALGSDAVIETTAVQDTHPQVSDGFLGRGITVQVSLETGGLSSAALRDCLVERSREIGVLVLGADATVKNTIVRDTLPGSDGSFGDGFTIVRPDSTATLTSTWIEASARAGIANFGAYVELSASTLKCNSIHLDGEPDDGAPFQFNDTGDNTCLCTETVPCKVLSSSLEAPTPVP